MKNLIVATAIAAVGCFAGIAGEGVETVNVYDLKVTLKAPLLENGVRTYKSVKYAGELYLKYVDSELTDVWAETQSKKTGAKHVTVFDAESFYRLMGKENKYGDRSVPTVYLTGSDTYGGDLHEAFKTIELAGSGSVKTVKTETTGCGVCGEATTVTSVCSILVSASGNVTGVMDCECPDDEDGWWHTVETWLCGMWRDDDGSVERSHDAAFWGTWSAKFNKRLSDTKLK